MLIRLIESLSLWGELPRAVCLGPFLPLFVSI